MITIVWTAFGVSLGAAVLHGTLGLRRPFDRTYLLFACIMILIAVFLYFEQAAYHATTPEQIVEAVRRQVMAAHAISGFFMLFIAAYLRLRLSRAVAAAIFGVLAVLFVVNLVSPYGLWFSAEPTLVHSSFRGEPYTVTVAPAMGLPQVAYLLYYIGLVVTGLVYASRAYRRGQRRRGLVLACAIVGVFLLNLVDVIREAVGGTWPYVAEFGFVVFGLIMSVELALDFRAQAERLTTTITQVEQQAERLTSIVDALLALEQNMNAPLARLETGIATLASVSPPERDQLERLRRAVTRLSELRRSMPDVSAPRRPD